MATEAAVLAALRVAPDTISDVFWAGLDSADDLDDDEVPDAFDPDTYRGDAGRAKKAWVATRRAHLEPGEQG